MSNFSFYGLLTSIIFNLISILLLNKQVRNLFKEARGLELKMMKLENKIEHTESLSDSAYLREKGF